MAEAPWTCDECGESVSRGAARLRLSDDSRAVAWDHRTDSNGRCDFISAVRNADGEPIEASARLANELNIRRPKRVMTVADMDESVAYFVEDVHALLWVSANVVSPAGLCPQVTLSHVDARQSSVLSSVPLGVTSEGGENPEYLFLRLGVGDWLLVSRDQPGTMRKMSGERFQEMLRAAGVTQDHFREVCRELDVS